MAAKLNSGYWSRGFWPGGYWPQDYWPDLPKKIVQWVADALDGVSDPDGTLTLNVIQPGILDVFESHFANGNVFVIGEDDVMETETAEPGRLVTALIRVYGLIVQATEITDKLLARITETVRRTLFAGNSAGRACDGLALNIDCPDSGFHAGPGCSIARIDVFIKYFFE
jgi:hypothetical protein